jgi:hypothetical protein
VVVASAEAQYNPQNEGESYEDLLEILAEYIDKESESKPFLVKNGVRVIL